MLSNELKRVDNYYANKTAKPGHRPSMKAPKTEKNYIEWKPRESWMNTLRNHEKPDASAAEVASNQAVENSKSRIRQSIKAIVAISDNNKQSQTVITLI